MFYKSYKVELLMGLEPATSSLPRKCSTPELQQHSRWKSILATKEQKTGYTVNQDLLSPRTANSF